MKRVTASNSKPINAFGKVLNRNQTYQLLGWYKFENNTLAAWEAYKNQGK